MSYPSRIRGREIKFSNSRIPGVDNQRCKSLRYTSERLQELHLDEESGKPPLKNRSASSRAQVHACSRNFGAITHGSRGWILARARKFLQRFPRRADVLFSRLCVPRATV